MFTAVQRTIFGHAAMVLFVALCAGIGLTMSLLGGLELPPGSIIPIEMPGDDRAWARAHSGGLLNAIMMIALGLLIPGLAFAARKAKRLAWMLVGTGWANTIFYWAALFAPNRAISLADNRWGAANWASIVGLLPALLFAFVMLYVAWCFAQQAFSGRPDNHN